VLATEQCGVAGQQDRVLALTRHTFLGPRDVTATVPTKGVNTVVMRRLARNGDQDTK